MHNPMQRRYAAEAAHGGDVGGGKNFPCSVKQGFVVYCP